MWKLVTICHWFVCSYLYWGVPIGNSFFGQADKCIWNREYRINYRGLSFGFRDWELITTYAYDMVEVFFIRCRLCTGAAGAISGIGTLRKFIGHVFWVRLGWTRYRWINAFGRCNTTLPKIIGNILGINVWDRDHFRIRFQSRNPRAMHLSPIHFWYYPRTICNRHTLLFMY